MINSLFFKKTVYLWGVIFLVLNVGSVGCSAQSIASEDGGGIPAVFISSGFGNEGHYALLVDKGTQQLIVYESRGDVIREKLRLRCSTGEISGPKERSGDKKTPEGVYFIVNRFTAKDLTPVYGTRAFPLDYPNLMDDMAGRTGYSIWIHGTDKPLKDRNSNGCIVLENSSIEQVEQYIALNRTPVIIVAHLSFQDVDTFNKSKEKISGFLTCWNRALETGSRPDFMKLYQSSALSGVSAWWHDWVKTKKAFKAISSPLSVEMKQIAVYRNRDVYLALFDQTLESGGRRISVGTRKLFFKSVDGRFRIVGDTYQTGGKKDAGGRYNQFITACRKLSEIIPHLQGS